MPYLTLSAVLWLIDPWHDALAIVLAIRGSTWKLRRRMRGFRITVAVPILPPLPRARPPISDARLLYARAVSYRSGLLWNLGDARWRELSTEALKICGQYQDQACVAAILRRLGNVSLVALEPAGNSGCGARNRPRTRARSTPQTPEPPAPPLARNAFP